MSGSCGRPHAPCEAHQPDLIQARAQSLAGQFVFDVQTHFVRDDFDHKELLGLNDFAAEHWNPKIKDQTPPGLKLEAELYAVLARQLPKTTIMSIGHRSAVVKLHQRHLEMCPEGDHSTLCDTARVAAPAE